MIAFIDQIDIVALGPNFASLGALGLFVIIRTFLSWTLALEVEGRWPWQPDGDPEMKRANTD